MTPRQHAERLLQEVWECPEQEVVPKAGTRRRRTERYPSGERLANIMAQRNITVSQMARMLQEHGIEADANRVSGLKYRGWKDPGSARKEGEIAAICDILDCTLADLFGPEYAEPSKPKPCTSKIDEEMLRMIETAFKGPKRSFLTDAIRMAYTAALNSEVVY